MRAINQLLTLEKMVERIEKMSHGRKDDPSIIEKKRIMIYCALCMCIDAGNAQLITAILNRWPDFNIDRDRGLGAPLFRAASIAALAKGGSALDPFVVIAKRPADSHLAQNYYLHPNSYMLRNCSSHRGTIRDYFDHLRDIFGPGRVPSELKEVIKAQDIGTILRSIDYIEAMIRPGSIVSLTQARNRPLLH